MFDQIARELSNEMVFPTSFDTLTRLHAALEDPAIGLARISALVAADPLVSTRLMALANSVTYNPAGSPIHLLHKAIERLGLHNVRSVALAVATRQMLLARGNSAFRALGNRIWAHSLHTASAAWVLARRLSRVNPDEAQLAGLIHNIGAFYMIYHGAQHDDLVADPDAMLQLLADWHDSVGHTLAIALGLPQKLADAILDQDAAETWPDPVHSLHDVVYAANLVASQTARWQNSELDLPAEQVEQLAALLERFGAEIDTHHEALIAAFS